MDSNLPITKLKAEILAGATVELTDKVLAKHKPVFDNHHHSAWIFLKLQQGSHVRLTAVDTMIPAAFILDESINGYELRYKDSGAFLSKIVDIEEEAVHAPEQLFLGMYEYCKVGCRFCPLNQNSQKIHYSLDDIYRDIDDSNGRFTSIGITTSVPPSLSPKDVVDEMIFITKKIREKVGESIPIGVSTKTPSLLELRELKEAGASEIRLNYEIANPELAKKLMQNKSQKDILTALELSVDVFGINHVSSNLLVGLGESDDDLISCIRMLAEKGVIATVYPYDSFESKDPIVCNFQRPSAERLIKLAIEHKRILEEYKLQPLALKTMCPACAASHIYPGRDI